MSVKIEIETVQAAWAVSAANLKLYLGVTISDHDTMITNMGKSAQSLVEAYTNRRLNAVTYNLWLDEWVDPILLPYSPVSAITHIKYYNTDNSLTEWSSANYQKDTIQEPAQIVPVSGVSFPTLFDRINAIEVQFVTGYSTIPEQFNDAIKLIVGDMYVNRVDAPREKFTAWQRLIYPEKIWTL